MARFPRRARLLKPIEFRAAFQQGRRFHDRWITAVVTPSTQDSPRLGLAIAKKSVPLAVQRNRIKRTIRESFRLQATQLPNVDIVILSKKGCADLSNAQLRAVLDQLWRRIRGSSPVS